MKNDNYKKWSPIPEMPGDLYFWSLNHKSGSLDILLKSFASEDKTLKIGFKGILCYRLALEVARMLTVHLNEPMYTFGVSETSDYLAWFKEESSGMFEDQVLMHLAICCSDNIIDIITDEYPIVIWE